MAANVWFVQEVPYDHRRLTKELNELEELKATIVQLIYMAQSNMVVIVGHKKED